MLACFDFLAVYTFHKASSIDTGPGFLLPKELICGTSLVVQWLRLRVPNAGGPGLISGQGTRSRMLQIRPGAAK